MWGWGRKADSDSVLGVEGAEFVGAYSGRKRRHGKSPGFWLEQLGEYLWGDGEDWKKWVWDMGGN